MDSTNAPAKKDKQNCSPQSNIVSSITISPFAFSLPVDRNGPFAVLAYHIQLSDKYDATKDIRRYLWRRLQDIGSRSYDSRARSQSWPTVENIEKLVWAASGQFVFAATIVKYVSERRSSPVDRLQTVVDWTPDAGQLARPFEALDMLYASILSAAKESYEAVDTNRGRNFLLLLRAHQINSDFRVGRRKWDAYEFDEILNLERDVHEVLVSDLHSLVVFQQDPDYSTIIQMYFYHRSFSEFLDSETRSKNLFIPETQVQAYVLEGLVRVIGQVFLEPTSTRVTFGTLSGENPVVALALYSNEGKTLSDQQILALAHNDGWRKFDQMLSETWHFARRRTELPAMLFFIMQRLKNELEEPGLADALKPYYDKWRQRVETALAEEYSLSEEE
ncbi:hypothetical protein EST38_g14626 [Candolleomyces aberdarensis]|uniref:Uncharacterized protein n=1 Tax=Candolleomyces aberdarensis TaxID=2316362 RepID=A0A4Q2CXT5_9AGAR|nr:hypothetical protein EST38_g14626 [Candolleomyces aberdarensis]